MDKDARQALVELLLLALYLDKHLSQQEDVSLERALGVLGWEPGRNNELNLAAAYSSAREAGNCDLRTEAFLQERIEVIKSGGMASTALELLGKVLASDGFTAAENHFLERVRSKLFD